MFYFGAPEGSLDRLKDKTAALFGKENPPLAVESEKDKSDGDRKDDMDASSERSDDEGSVGENSRSAVEDVDPSLPTGLPEPPPVDLGSDRSVENGEESETGGSGDKEVSDEFSVEIVSPDDTP